MRLLSCLAFLGTLAPAQTTYVVNAAGGGAFTDLPAAIAAVPSGSVLRIKPGLYSAFTIANKSLTLLGDDPSSVVVRSNGSPIVLGPTTASQKIVVRDLRYDTGDLITAGQLTIKNAAGPVLLQRLVYTGAPPTLFGGATTMTIESSPNVHLLECTLTPPGLAQSQAGPAMLTITGSSVEISGSTLAGNTGAAPDQHVTYPGTPAIAATGSFLHVVASRVTGGRGVDGGGLWTVIYPGVGGAGMKLTQTSLHAVASVVSGGSGGNATTNLSYGGAGGAGLLAAAGTTVRDVGSIFTGGAGGTSTAGNGGAGVAYVLQGGALLTTVSAPASYAFLQGTPAPGLAVTCSLLSRPGDFALVAFGDDVVMTQFPGLITTGALGVLPLFAMGLYQVPASGRLDVPLQLWSAWPLDRVLAFQFFTVPPSADEVWASNLATLVAKS